MSMGTIGLLSQSHTTAGVPQKQRLVLELWKILSGDK